MLKKVFIAASLLATSMAAQAGLISHFGYERESSSNIVKGGGLEWLMWDVTTNKSVNQALTEYSGWRLANISEMTSLFNSFRFGKMDWMPGNQHLSPWTPDELSAHNSFSQLFGFTNIAPGVCNTTRTVSCYSPKDLSATSWAWYAGRTTGRTGSAGVTDDSTFVMQNGRLSLSQGTAWFTDGVGTYDGRNASVGVALVRTKIQDPIQVNTPASFGLIAMGLVALSIRRRQVLRR